MRRIFVTPSLVRRLERLSLPSSTRNICVGGESPPALSELRRVFGTNVDFWNLYGLTELSIWSTVVKIDSSPRTPLFHPTKSTLVDGTRAVSITDDGRLVIHVDQSRHCVVNSRSPTSDHFVTDDLVSEGKDGEIFFLSRNHGLKRNGKLVNLDDIGSNLKAQDEVEYVHVFVDGDKIVAAVFIRQAVSRIPDLKLALISKCRKSGAIPEELAILPFSLALAPLTMSHKLDMRAVEDEARALFGRRSLVGELPSLWARIMDRVLNLWFEYYDLENRKARICDVILESVFQSVNSNDVFNPDFGCVFWRSSG